jgi:hypothetical protein
VYLGQTIDFRKTELQNAKLHNLASDPAGLGSTDKGLVWFNTTSGQAKTWNGTAADPLTTVLDSVSGTAPIQVAAVSSKNQVISIQAASGSNAGSMSASDYTKLAGATDTNTASALVARDGSGNFSAGTITAALTGTASNATNLNSQAASYYLARANHTGTQLSSTISDLASTVQAYRLDQFAAATNPISGVDPTSGSHLATKNYVDSLAIGLDVKKSVRASSTANVSVTYTATGGTSGRGQITAAPNTLDGVSLAANDRILLKNQTTGAQNGIYVVTTLGSGANGVWDRATDFDADSDVSAGAFAFVEEGTTNADSGWVLTTNNPITVGGSSGTSLAFAQFSSAAAITAGDGLTKVGSVISAVGTTNRITIQSGAGIDIAATYVGQTSITTLGTITTGTWTGTAVAVANGGTGATSAATARSNLGATTKVTANVGDGTSTTVTVTHNLGTKDVVTCLYDASTNEEVLANPIHATTNTVTFGFASAPASNAFKAVVIG